MKYRSDLKAENRLSVLGFGCMRFPRNPVQVDMKKTEKLILDAIQGGVNYFDTAYLYPGSEEALGQILAKHGLHDKVYIATKLPIGLIKSYEDFDRYFAVSLERLKTDHIDYYFMHNIPDLKQWQSLCALGAERWIAEKKAAGQIHRAGFSFHGVQSEFFAVLDAYDWDFCQIQYNYVNENYQAGKAGLKRAAEKGLPVIIMEPLLGGKLATGLPKEAVRLFHDVDKTRSPAEWALRWLWDRPEVTVVLSGMSSDAQLAENIRVAAQVDSGMLTPREKSVYDTVLAEFNKSYKIPCTGCNYCMPCPQNVNIPGCFAAYNISHAMGMISGMQLYVTGTAATNPDKSFLASRCVGCGTCERHCPQHISIASALMDVKKRLEPFWFQPAMNAFRRWRA